MSKRSEEGARAGFLVGLSTRCPSCGTLLGGETSVGVATVLTLTTATAGQFSSPTRACVPLSATERIPVSPDTLSAPPSGY